MFIMAVGKSYQKHSCVIFAKFSLYKTIIIPIVMTNNSHREVTSNSMALYTCFTLFLYCATAKLVIPTKAQVGKYTLSHTRFEERVELEYYISRLGIGLLVPKHSFALRQEPPWSDLIRYTLINISSLSIIKSQKDIDNFSNILCTVVNHCSFIEVCGEENVHGIPDACVNPNFTYLAGCSHFVFR